MYQSVQREDKKIWECTFNY